MAKVLAAMSGGVDSSVAVSILKEQGHEVFGITMDLWSASKSADEKGCCGIEAIHDAKRVADKLNIPHYTINLRDAFKKYVIDNFIEEYSKGRTPNPCVRCNQFLKFDFLTKKAEELGAAFVATGHYARIQNPKSSDAKVQLWTTASEILNPKQSQISKYKLLKGNDPTKDQSYFLYVMSQQSLSKTLFPIGDLEKKEVRKIAKGLALTVAEKKESQEICFVNNDYRDFLKANIPNALKKGDIIDTSGKKVGTHDGILFYTIGQRRGIGAHLEKKYVVSLDIKNNTVTIGNNSDLMKTTLTAENLNFISGELPMDGLEVLAKIRYNSPGSPAKISIIDKDKVKVEFEKPQRAVTPGQSVVFYLGDEVLGGGIISA